MTRLLTIAGHDPVHGAGLTADLAVWAAMGLDGCSAVTALTVQNSRGLQEVLPTDPRALRRVLQAVLTDGEPAAVKVGLLGSVAIMREVTEFIAARSGPVVVDPVLGGSNGVSAFDAGSTRSARDDLREALQALMRQADVITPNLPEAAWLLGVPEREVASQAEALQAWSAGAVVLKGGHGTGASSADRVWSQGREALLSSPRQPGSAHGSGCVFSAALAGLMAQGWDVFNASCEAKLRATAGLMQARPAPGRPHMHAAPVLDSRALPTFHWVQARAPMALDASQASPDSQTSRDLDGERTAMSASLPAKAPQPSVAQDESADNGSLPPVPFPALTGPLGFYAVLPTADWIERALGWGVRTLQLRIKAGAMPHAELQAQLRAAISAAAAVPGAQLFINDHAREAMALGAYGVHLGQEDIDVAPLDELRRSGLRLGVSTHTPLEMSRAHALRPSYLAIGPVYPTTLKAMAYEPVGRVRLRDWAKRCQPAYPVVAIGGISLDRAPAVMAAGADGLAVVSALTQAADPAAAAAAFLKVVGQA